jgi:hypothetical protein
MKKFALLLSLALFGSNQATAQASTDLAGSNISGSEKMCVFGANMQSDQAVQDILKVCRRGDILDIGWMKTSFAIQLCDFTKTVVYNPSGTVVACVYTGVRRQTGK